jgi:hypothetical protein
MRNVTEAFISALRGSHRMVSDVRILTSYQEGVQPEGTLLSTIRGSVTLSSTANIRGSATVLIGDVTWPQLNDDLLTPYGNEAFIRRGIDYGNGTIEWVSLGYFRLDDVSQSTNSKYPLQITCYDRMIGIIEARLLTPVQFFAGITVGEIVETLVWEVYPDATIEWDDDTHGIIVTRTQIAEQDRYGFLNDLITSYGKIMYFDYRGMLVIESVPSTTSTQVRTACSLAPVDPAPGRACSTPWSSTVSALTPPSRCLRPSSTTRARVLRTTTDVSVRFPTSTPPRSSRPPTKRLQRQEVY